MLIILSPAKKLDLSTHYSSPMATEPLFLDQAQSLMDILKHQSVEDVQALMDISPALAKLNVDRYQIWQKVHSSSVSKPAVLMFNGDVYEGLQAHTLSHESLLWAQSRLLILSGLYGVLRPLDQIQPHRLEMGTRLVTSNGKNLYEFWGDTQTNYLNEQSDPLLINLASDEYTKVINWPRLNKKVINCVFHDLKNGQYKMISFYAKRARGLMAKYIIEHQVNDIDGLMNFNMEGYVYTPEVSSSNRLVFRRDVKTS